MRPSGIVELSSPSARGPPVHTGRAGASRSATSPQLEVAAEKAQAHVCAKQVNKVQRGGREGKGQDETQPGSPLKPS